MQLYLNRMMELLFRYVTVLCPIKYVAQMVDATILLCVIFEIFLPVSFQKIKYCWELECWECVQPLIHCAGVRQSFCLWKIIHWQETRKHGALMTAKS